MRPAGYGPKPPPGGRRKPKKGGDLTARPPANQTGGGRRVGANSGEGSPDKIQRERLYHQSCTGEADRKERHKMKKDFQVQLSTKIAIPTWQALDEYAKSSGQSKASIVERAINLYLELIAEGRIDD